MANSVSPHAFINTLLKEDLMLFLWLPKSLHITHLLEMHLPSPGLGSSRELLSALLLPEFFLRLLPNTLYLVNTSPRT